MWTSRRIARGQDPLDLYLGHLTAAEHVGRVCLDIRRLHKPRSFGVVSVRHNREQHDPQGASSMIVSGSMPGIAIPRSPDRVHEREPTRYQVSISPLPLTG